MCFLKTRYSVFTAPKPARSAISSMLRSVFRSSSSTSFMRTCSTTNDGDTIYTLASGKLGSQASAAVPLDLLGMLAVRALETAIVNGAKTAKTSHGIPGVAK